MLTLLSSDLDRYQTSSWPGRFRPFVSTLHVLPSRNPMKSSKSTFPTAYGRCKHVYRRLVTRLPTRLGQATATTPAPPTMPGSLPILEDLPRVDMARKHHSHHQLLNEANVRVLQVRYMGKCILLVREPDDVVSVLSRKVEAFSKHPRQQRVKAWLGESLATQPDPVKHAAQREVLAPAFRAEYVRQLDGVMAAAAARLVAAVRHAYEEEQGLSASAPRSGSGPPALAGPSSSAGATPGPSPPWSCSPRPTSISPPSSGDPGPGLRLDAQDLFRRLSLDVLGLASLRVDLGALRRSGAVGKGVPQLSRTPEATGSGSPSTSPGAGAAAAAGAAAPPGATGGRHMAPGATMVPGLDSDPEDDPDDDPDLDLDPVFSALGLDPNALDQPADMDPGVDLHAMMNEVETSALWLLMQLPVPDRFLPGYDKYDKGVAVLDELIYGLIQRRRERGVRDEDRDLLAFLLRAQQRQRQQHQQVQLESPPLATATRVRPEGSGDHIAAVAAVAVVAAAAGAGAGSGGCPFAAAARAAPGSTAEAPATSPPHPTPTPTSSPTPTPTSPVLEPPGGCPAGAGEPAVEITDRVIRDELMVSFHAGTDSSAITLSMACHHLAQCPDLQGAVRAEVLEVLAGRPVASLSVEDLRRLPLLAAVVNETQRLYPGLPEITRLAQRDEVVGGYSVTRGSTVVLSLYSMQRHPAIWPRPEDWLPQRWVATGASRHACWPEGQGLEALGPRQPNAFLPFGSGIRSCIGRNSALQSMQIFLAALLATTDLLPEPSAPIPDIAYSIAIRSTNGVWLRFRPRPRS